MIVARQDDDTIIRILDVTSLHKLAKTILVDFLNKNRTIAIRSFDEEIGKFVTNINIIPPDAIVKEDYRLDDENIVDVAVISGEQLTVFEIFATHKVEEGSRPEPWYEFSAMDIFKYYNYSTPFRDLRRRDSSRIKAGDTILDFGQHIGTAIKSVPIEYIYYLTQKFPFFDGDRLGLGPRDPLKDGDRFLRRHKNMYIDQANRYMDQRCYGCKKDILESYNFCEICSRRLKRELS